MYPPSYEINPATRFCGKIEGWYTVHLPYRFGTAENAVCWSRSTVCLFNHFTTVLRTSEFAQVSPSLSTMTKGNFLWYAFLNVQKRLLSAGDGFAGAWSIDLAMLSLEHETFLQMALSFWRSIQLAASRICSLWETLENFFFLHHVFCTCAEHFQEQICIFLSFVPAQCVQNGFHKLRHKSFSYSRKGCVCLLLLFHEWQNPELLRGYLYFQNALLILIILQNK